MRPAWRAETIDYGEPYTMRTDFVRLTTTGDTETIRVDPRRSASPAIATACLRRAEFSQAAATLTDQALAPIYDELRAGLEPGAWP
ncbi:MAG TPA: hypothetical protein VFL67_08640 [Mycobacterium sp.]|nr:hypothetical protein [Mycobacterium sp.]